MKCERKKCCGKSKIAFFEVRAHLKPDWFIRKWGCSYRQASKLSRVNDKKKKKRKMNISFHSQLGPKTSGEFKDRHRLNGIFFFSTFHMTLITRLISSWELPRSEFF
jgi:hypothetical protein